MASSPCFSFTASHQASGISTLKVTTLRQTSVPARQIPSVAGLRALPSLHASSSFVNVAAGRQALFSSATPRIIQQQRSVGGSARCDAAVAEAETAAPEQKFEYQAEVSRLLDLIVNSLYSHKEVFLRELVSNASDALDKLRFLSVTDKDLMADGSELAIKIKVDKEAGLITIMDSGIGMTREELQNSLGTIAESGTAKFAQALKDKQEQNGVADSNLIGQFGVGFYSAFLVADKVTVSSRSPRDTKQWVWEAAEQQNSYVIREETDPGKLIPRGTVITLHLKGDAKYEYTEVSRIEGLVKNYSQFISFPIYLWTEQSRQVEVEEEVEAKEGEEPQKKTKTVEEKYFDWQLTNSMKPIWVRDPKSVEGEEYNSFYKSTFSEFVDPAAYTHFVTEGEIEFRSLLYTPSIPRSAPDDFISPQGKNVRLYVRRVFISDEFQGELFPRYLNFIQGVVDSNDLPLNVSREILQESRIIRIMKKRLIRKTFDMFDEIAAREDKDAFNSFYSSFSKNLKLGCIEDHANHNRIAPLLRFNSSKSGEDLTSLADYVARMKPEQTSIFFFAADSVRGARSAPFLEALEKKDLEVLFLVDPIDELAITNLAKFNDKKFVDISKEDLDLGDIEDKEQEKKVEDEHRVLCDWMKQVLGDKVSKVQVSKRIESSPCVLVAGKFGFSANMERIMKAQAMGDSDHVQFMRGNRILEINANHRIIKDLNVACKDTPNSPDAKAMADLLFETAHMSSGFPPENPAEYGSKIYDIMAQSLQRKREEREELASLGLATMLKPEEAEVVEASEIRSEGDPWKST